MKGEQPYQVSVILHFLDAVTVWQSWRGQESISEKEDEATALQREVLRSPQEQYWQQLFYWMLKTIAVWRQKALYHKSSLSVLHR